MQRAKPNSFKVVQHEVGSFLEKMNAVEPQNPPPESEQLFDSYWNYQEAAKEENREGMTESRENMENSLEKIRKSNGREEEEAEWIKRALDGLRAYEAYASLTDDFRQKSDIGTVELEYITEPFNYTNRFEGEIETDIPSNQEVQGNEALWIVSNTIMSNWYDHGGGNEEDSHIHIMSEEDEHSVYLRIRNDGPGYNGNPEDLFTYDNCSVRGTGLPLAKYITESCGGNLDYVPTDNGFGLDWKLSKAD